MPTATASSSPAKPAHHDASPAAPVSPVESAPHYQELCRHLRSAATIGTIEQLVSWDQETQMPHKAASFRAEQLSMLSALAHERRTSPKIGELIAKCEADSSLTKDPLAGANLREMRRDYDRAKKLPGDLVAEMADTNSRAMEAWKQARADADFKQFRPWLQKQVDLNKRKAECYGFPRGGELYDALLEDFEPGMTAKEVDSVFGPLRKALAPLIQGVLSSGVPPHDAVHRVKLPLEKQKEYNAVIAKRLGYDFDGGVLAVSTHPFSSGIAPGDTRMTTRYREDHFAEALSTTLHESGHSLYEQGLPKESRLGQPLGESISLGIHESQSRMWENQVGRSQAFWEWALPEAQKVFGAPLDSYTPQDMFKAMNIVKSRFIRVDSDEATYNLHIMLRFDIERALLQGDMKVDDVPGYWNERMKKDLNLDVPNDAKGCLQDVHWSMGAIGYFPTYTLGTMYAAQMWETIRKAVPDIDVQMRMGEFGSLLAWLRANVHVHGRRYKAPELCERLTGKTLSHEPFIAHLKAKFGPIYGL